MKLRDSKLRSLKPRAKPYRVSDGRGLTLVVGVAGGKSWVYRYRVNGRERVMTLGQYPYLTLEKARRAHFEARSAVLEGRDPAAERAEEAAAADRGRQDDFASFARLWQAEKVVRLAPKTRQKVESIIEADLIPLLGHTRISSLSTPEAVSALETITARAPSMARKAQSYLSQMVDFAIKRGLREERSHLSLRGAVKLPKATSVPAATDLASLADVMRKIDAQADRVLRGALLMTALSALRPSNVVSARWSMMDLDAGVWSIPAEEMKTREAHALPITRQMAEILAEARGWWDGQSDYVFPAIAGRKTPHTRVFGWRIGEKLGMLDDVLI